MIHHSLEYLEYLYFWEGDTVTKEFGPKINKENAENLHGINYTHLYLKPRSYNRTVMRFISAILTPGEHFDFKTACEVKTRIYVREESGKWVSVPKRKFWKDQCRLLWTVWRNFVNYNRPKTTKDMNALEIARLAWSDRLMHQIDARRSTGEYRYNPLLSVKSRRKLRELYEKHVFNRDLYNAEKGKPGRKRKAGSCPRATLDRGHGDEIPVTAMPTQSVPGRTSIRTTDQTPSVQVLEV